MVFMFKIQESYLFSYSGLKLPSHEATDEITVLIIVHIVLDFIQNYWGIFKGENAYFSMLPVNNRTDVR